MKELGITKGEWKSAIFFDDLVVRTPNEIIADVISTNGDEDGPLIADAGNTTQKCGLLPSELLQQRDELREALIEVMVILKDCYPLLFDNEKPAVRQAEAAIKNTETK